MLYTLLTSSFSPFSYIVLKNLIKTLVIELVNPLSEDKILDWSKLKQIADDILKCI